MTDITKPTGNVWLLLDDTTAKYLIDVLDKQVDSHAKNVAAIDRALGFIDHPSKERTHLTKVSNNEYEKLQISHEILRQLHLAYKIGSEGRAIS